MVLQKSQKKKGNISLIARRCQKYLVLGYFFVSVNKISKKRGLKIVLLNKICFQATVALKMVYVGYLVISAWSSSGVMAQEKPHHSTLVQVVITPHSQKKVNYLLEDVT